jgi:lipopolysaccharide export system permease protein
VALVILSRYLGTQLLRGWLVVLVILASLFALLSLVEEIDSLSERYRFLHALYYVALTTPQRVLELAPVVAALGTVLAFAVLSRHSELVVIRAAGISLSRLLRMILAPLLALVIALALASELLVADLHHRAETRRSVLRSGNLDLLEGRGLWSGSGSRFINVRELRIGQNPRGISLYEFASDGSLLRAIEADTAELLPDRRWRLLGVRTKEWTAEGLSNRRQEALDLGPFWSAEELPALGQSFAAMPPSALYRYAEHLRSTGQDDSRVRMAFWQKVALPLSAAAMVVLCAVIGVGFGSTRSAAFGWRVLAGAVIGVGFYLLTQILHTAGQLLGLDQVVVAMLPIVLVVALAAGVAAATR